MVYQSELCHSILQEVLISNYSINYKQKPAEWEHIAFKRHHFSIKFTEPLINQIFPLQFCRLIELPVKLLIVSFMKLVLFKLVYINTIEAMLRCFICDIFRIYGVFYIVTKTFRKD